MSLLRLEPGDDLDELVKQWLDCNDETKKREIVESHYWHRESLRGPDKLLRRYWTLMEKIGTARRATHSGLSYRVIYDEVRSREGKKAVEKLLKRLVIIVGIVAVIAVSASIASTSSVPRRTPSQRHKFDPADDPRSDSGGYRTRGL